MQENISLLSFNTFHIDEKAAFFDIFDSEQKLEYLIDEANNINNNIKILGGGSNILLTASQNEIVLKNEIKGIEIIEENNEDVFVKFGAGEIWHDCVLWALKKNLGGIENLALIPGTIGASPIQNIGAYGVELKDVFHSLEAIEIESKNKKIFYNSECEFDYRNSVFKTHLKNKFVITHVILRLEKNHKLHLNYGNINEILIEKKITTPAIHDVANAVIEIRKNKLPDPNEIGNAGSFFKNVIVEKNIFENIYNKNKNVPHYILSENEIKIPTAWLVEQCGWKGFREKDYGVHHNQALVLVNYKNASGKEIFTLSENIISSVKEKFDVILEREVNIW